MTLHSAKAVSRRSCPALVYAECAAGVYPNGTMKKYSNGVGFGILAYAGPRTGPIGSWEGTL